MNRVVSALRCVLFPMFPPSDLRGLDRALWLRRRWLLVGLPAFALVAAAEPFLIPRQWWLTLYLVAMWVMGFVGLQVAIHYATQSGSASAQGGTQAGSSDPGKPGDDVEAVATSVGLAGHASRGDR